MTQIPRDTAGRNIAVLIPCYQEESTIAKVVTDFRRALPEARIYVFDNNCTDRTAEYAAAAGAIVIPEKQQGKGFVVAAMFDKVEADYFVMVDGDDTYDATAADALLSPLFAGRADMTVAGRLTSFESNSFRGFHILGNRLVCGIINWMFDADIHDVFSGYRAFTRDAVNLIPITARGFDVETELTLQALYRGLVITEIQAPYRARPEGSLSKLKTGSDGALVLLKLFLMLRSYKPLTFFGGLSVVLFVLAAIVARSAIATDGATTASVRAAIGAATLTLLSAFSLGLGLLLNSVNLRLLEVEKFARKKRR